MGKSIEVSSPRIERCEDTKGEDEENEWAMNVMLPFLANFSSSFFHRLFLFCLSLSLTWRGQVVQLEVALDLVKDGIRDVKVLILRVARLGHHHSHSRGLPGQESDARVLNHDAPRMVDVELGGGQVVDCRSLVEKKTYVILKYAI